MFKFVDAADHGMRRDILYLSGVEKLLSLLKSTNVDVQLNAAGALFNLALSGTASSKLSLMNSGQLRGNQISKWHFCDFCSMYYISHTC